MLQAQATEQLSAEPYERTEERHAQAASGGIVSPCSCDFGCA
ncbi:hypothetical protein ACT91Q_22280 [Brevibacillus thermoruber]